MKFMRITAVLIAAFFVFSATACGNLTKSVEEQVKKEASSAEEKIKKELDKEGTQPEATKPAATKGSTTKESTAKESTGDGSESPLAKLFGDKNKKTMPDNYSYEMVTSTDAGAVPSLKLWVKGKKSRVQAGDGEGAMDIYTDMEKSVSYMYVKAQNMAVKVPMENKADSSNPYGITEQMDKDKLENFKLVGKEIIDGNECSHYESKVLNITSGIWVDNKTGIPLKLEVKDDSGKAAMFTYFRNFKTGNVTDDMVTLPKGINIQG